MMLDVDYGLHVLEPPGTCINAAYIWTNTLSSATATKPATAFLARRYMKL